jgi:hypothetical protein
VQPALFGDKEHLEDSGNLVVKCIRELAQADKKIRDEYDRLVQLYE